MENLEKFGVMEMGAKERNEVDGGFAILVAIAVIGILMLIPAHDAN